MSKPRPLPTFVFFLICATMLNSCMSPQTAKQPSLLPPATLRTATIPKVTETVNTSPTAEIKSSTEETPAPIPAKKFTSTSTPVHLPEHRIEIFPDPDTVSWQVIASDFDTPTSIANAGDGTDRLFILEKAGLVRVIQEGMTIDEPFIDLRDRVRTQGYTTAGLLGMAVHPQFDKNGLFFLFYTAANGDSVISRFSSKPGLSAGDPDSEQILLAIPQPVGEHRGGDLMFGPDGYLYVSIGDGGGPGYGDPDHHAQNPDSLLGKILRLDVDTSSSYLIPPDNPYSSSGGVTSSREGAGEVWLIGLRNPWRFSFDPITGDLYIADVGESSWEEINYLDAGETLSVGQTLSAGEPVRGNYGWNFFEGKDTFPQHSQQQPPSNIDFTDPIWVYDHSQGCSVTGGYVYRGQMHPEWNGIYLYGDYCQGNIWGLLHRPDGAWENQLISKIPAFISSFGVDEDGEIYLADVGGKIWKWVVSIQE